MIELISTTGESMQTPLHQNQTTGIYTLQANTAKLMSGTYMIKTTITTKDETTYLHRPISNYQVETLLCNV